MRHGTHDLRRSKVLLWLARRVDFRDDHLICIFEGTCKIQEERLCTRIGMRLPNCPDACLWETGPRARERGPDFRRVMSIIIEDADPFHFATQLKTTTCSSKFGKCLCCLPA